MDLTLSDSWIVSVLLEQIMPDFLNPLRHLQSLRCGSRLLSVSCSWAFWREKRCSFATWSAKASASWECSRFSIKFWLGNVPPLEQRIQCILTSHFESSNWLKPLTQILTYSLWVSLARLSLFWTQSRPQKIFWRSQAGNTLPRVISQIAKFKVEIVGQNLPL